MIVRLVKLTIEREKLNEALQLLEEIAPRVRAMEGCHFLEISRGIAPRENEIITYSQWDSVDHLNAYRDTELFGNFWNDLKTRFEKPASARSYDRIHHLH
jgi:quinol monooxygenase YgiN